MEAAIISTGIFTPIDRSQWLEGSRAGAPVPPSYADLQFEQLRQNGTEEGAMARPGAGWTIVQRIDDTDARRANHQAQEDIAEGATGLAIVFEGAPNAFGYGLPARPEALAAALHHIPLSRVYLRVDVHPAARASVDWLIELMRRRKADPGRISLSFGIDPAAIFAGSGALRMSIEALHASMPQSLAHFFAMGIPAVLLEADGRVVHNAGGSEAQELGVMLASAVSHLRMFQEARQPLVYAAPHIGFAIAIDQNQFLSVAKLRALRRLWAKVQEICAIPPAQAKVHAETSYRMLSARDPETNILRTSLAAFAAAAGGADTISVLPHTLPHGLPERRARRLARNAQLVLAEETHLSFLGNPSATSEDLDILTASLCASAWEELRQIEAEGGLFASLAAGHVQKRVAEARAQRLERLRAETLRIVGDTLHVPDEAPAVAVLHTERRPVASEGAVFCERLPAIRLDEMLGQD
ncbi:MAG: methylmalonyl-CoA mutase [Hyphomicrobiales bacterium]|nr:MAG: methylmalonyl-CoA mutase [Hyphomicrobiales bacterium]